MLVIATNQSSASVRIKDITDLHGARSNDLLGIGLIVGLNGTGGTKLVTQKAVVDMLDKFKLDAKYFKQKPSDNLFKSTNTAIVAVAAELGPFSRHGSRIDVKVMAVDDCTSLRGGVLLPTQLLGADGVTYAVARGPVHVGGFLVTAPSGTGPPLSTAQKNHPTVGRISSGATVEREVRGDIVCNNQLRLLVREADYVTATNIAKTINMKFPLSSVALDAGTVQVLLPRLYRGKVVQFAADIGLMEVDPGIPARVVINSNTGTIVAGEHVKISTVAVAHGNLTIATHTDLIPSQPAPFSKGKTTVVPRTSIDVQEQGGHLHLLNRTTTVGELARAMRALGATPQDMITIFQMLKRSGALHAKLIPN